MYNDPSEMQPPPEPNEEELEELIQGFFEKYDESFLKERLWTFLEEFYKKDENYAQFQEDYIELVIETRSQQDAEDQARNNAEHHYDQRIYYD